VLRARLVRRTTAELVAAMPAEKLCPACRAVLPACDFGLHRCKASGLASYCRKCSIRRTRLYRAADRSTRGAAWR